ncbi:6-phosphogluconolactonase [Propionibacterium freudenreichii]|nr:6-phosphogluconolactonase [Propionibacterium freudenreichii]MCT2993369.1 6-phosphogluconolactonase [Propionibacterium freudenreichii]MCT2997860.1 6-phosphogluconolactonase [Propionibacterium freudenreichii]MCT3002885.1 6-phosphogluconolactonase [Propionibacterium freudenreichii]
MMAPPMTSAPRVLRYLDNEELTTGAGTLLVSALAEMQRRQEYVNLCLSGGPTVLSALTHFAALARTGAFDASRLQLWWASERFVTTTDPVRNSVQALSILAGAVTLVPSQIHAMPSRTGKTDPDDAAYAYAKDIGDTQFDITMLELGDDGHIASIFPNHPSYAVQSTTTLQAVGVADAPMGPPERVTLTLPAINRSRQVWMLASGATKQDALAGSLRGESRYPASQAHGADWTLWFADQDAAGELPCFRCDL